MSDSQEQSFSNNPYAPKIPSYLYPRERADFFGVFIASVFYGTREVPHLPVHLSMLTPFVWFISGVAIVLSFKCLAALFNPIYRRGEPIKWGLVSFTMAMFSIATIGTTMNLNVLSISYIDNREYSGVEGVIPPGPIGYRWLISPNALTIVPNIMFFLTNWLGDGLLVGSLFGATPAHPDV